ncbi:flagellin N-terminal helical domain-containing protein, partial [Pseudomonas syringae group genomosp. 7]
RISTTQFFESTNTNYQRNYSNMNKTSEEVSSGIKLNTARDDPVGAARVLQLAQQNSMLTQYETNICTIITMVVTTDTTLSCIIETLQASREQIVSAGS